MNQTTGAPAPQRRSKLARAIRGVASMLWIIPLAAALAAIVFVTMEVLAPTASEPQSNLYNSSLGYPAQQRRAGKPIEVKTVRVEEHAFSEAVAAAGETVALVDVDLRPQITGLVEEVLVVEGQRVTKGEPLVKLEQAPLEDQLARAKANLRIAQLDAEYAPQVRESKRKELEASVAKSKELLDIIEQRHARYASLKSASAASAEEIAMINELRATRIWEMATAREQLASHLLDAEEQSKKQQHTLTTREASVREAERALKNATLLAPCDGMVTRVSTQPGEVLVDEVAAVTLTGDVVFKAFIDQTQVDSVKSGDLAIVRLLAHPGTQFHGKVIRVNPSIDTRGVVAERGRIDTRFTYSAWVKLDGQDVPPGLQGHVEFRKELSKPSVPESAVIHLSGGEGMVMVVRDGRAAVTRVDLGPAHGEVREVRSGLSPGDEVVLYPLGLKADDLLQPMNGASDENTEQVASRR